MKRSSVAIESRPKPVSALIHAATMVTAGVYMIGRNAVLFSHTPDTLMIVAVIGAATALFAGTIGLVQNDIKRVLAYSTVSQLGLMFLAMGVGAFGAGIFHLYTHAFFKACLFLGSGAVIHALHGEQDIRNMGGLKKFLPITYWTFLIGSLAIAGIPPLAGFFSKDELLFETFKEGHTILWVVGALTSLLTATYMFRLVMLTFHGERRHDAPAPADAHPTSSHGGSGATGSVADHSHGHDAHAAHLPSHGAAAGGHGHPPSPHGHGGGHGMHDAPPAMALALIVLALGSVAAGWVGIPHGLGGHNNLHAWLSSSFSAPGAAVHEESDEVVGGLQASEAGEVAVAGGLQTSEEAHGAAAEHDEIALERTLMGVSIFIAFLGVGIGLFIWGKRRDIAAAVARQFSGVHQLLLNKYYIDELYDQAIVNPIRIISERGLWKSADVKLIDGAVNGAAAVVDAGAVVLRRLQSGSVRTYAGSVIVGVVVILGYYLWR